MNKGLSKQVYLIVEKGIIRNTNNQELLVMVLACNFL